MISQNRIAYSGREDGGLSIFTFHRTGMHADVDLENILYLKGNVWKQYKLWMAMFENNLSLMEMFENNINFYFVRDKN